MRSIFIKKTMELFTVSWLTMCLSVLFVAWHWHRRRNNMPPGPRGVPLLGVIPYLGTYPARKLAQWGRVYGPIMTVRFGRQDWVVLNDYNAINEAFAKNHESFSGRPKAPVVDVITAGGGIVLIDGEKWKLQRKFGLMTLRDFGMGKRSMESSVVEEVEYMNDVMRKHQGKPFFIKETLCHSVSNVICGVVFGRRFDYDDPWFKSLMRIVEKWMTDPTTSGVVYMLAFAPLLQYIPPFRGFMKDLKRDMGILSGELASKVKEHEETFQKDDLRDFIDAFLLEMRQEKDTFTAVQLVHYIQDLFSAGTETTTSTLAWAIICLVHYPVAQEKLHREIVEVVGDNGVPTMSFKDNMPYTSAFIHELQRYRTLGPLSIPHRASNDAVLSGFSIPKDTIVLANIWAVHNDPNLWNEPEKFRPERHLDADGQFVKSNYVIPFSVGPRHCLGRLLAQIEIFIFLTSMVQKFEFLPASSDLPDIEKGSKGTVFSPHSFQVIANERQ